MPMNNINALYMYEQNALTVLGFILGAMMLELLAPSVAAFTHFQCLFEKFFCLHNGGSLLLS